jgi:hypothetical protein
VITRSHRQEGLCRAYVQAVAAQAGLNSSVPSPDYGIDLSLRSVGRRGDRHRDAGVQLDIQLKSTKQDDETETHLAYDLEVDYYEDLRDVDVPCPRILVVLFLPADESQWLSQSPNELMLRRCAHWLSLKGAPPTRSKRTVRVFLPRVNLFTPDVARDILQRIRERRDP